MPNNFQGKEVELKLKVFSSFTTDMITDSVYTIPRDSRFSFKHAVYDGRTVVMSGEKTKRFVIKFDPQILRPRLGQWLWLRWEEWSLPLPEFHGSNPVKSKIL